jgi:hypothetical protein
MEMRRLEDMALCSMRVLQDTKERIETSRALDQSHRSGLVNSMRAIRLSLAQIKKSDRLIDKLWGRETQSRDGERNPGSEPAGA